MNRTPFSDIFFEQPISNKGNVPIYTVNQLIVGIAEDLKMQLAAEHCSFISAYYREFDGSKGITMSQLAYTNFEQNGKKILIGISVTDSPISPDGVLIKKSNTFYRSTPTKLKMALATHESPFNNFHAFVTDQEPVYRTIE